MLLKILIEHNILWYVENSDIKSHLILYVQKILNTNLPKH